MLRITFVFAIILLGIYYSLQGPFYILLFYLWNGYFKPEGWVWIDLLWSLHLSLTIGIFLVLASLGSLSKIRWNGLSLLVVAFIAHGTLSLLTSAYFGLIWDFWGDFLRIMIVMFLIPVLVDDERRYRMTLTVIAFSLGFEAAKQGWATFVLHPGSTNNNENLLLGDNNGVAMGLMMLIPVFLALSETATRKWERPVLNFFIAGVFYRAISTYSRGGFLAAGVVLLVSLARAQHKIRNLVFAGVLAYTVASVMPQSFWDRMNTINEGTETSDNSVQYRLYYWGLARQMASDHPVFGVGPNGFRYAFYSYDRGASQQGTARAVHSTWFGLLAELGGPGLLLFIAVIVASIRTCQRTRARAQRDGRRDVAIYATHLQTSFVVFVVAGTFLHSQYMEMFWHLVGLTLALERISQAPATVAVAPPVVSPERRYAQRPLPPRNFLQRS